MKIALVGGVRASLAALEAFHDGGVDVSVFGLAAPRAARHSDYCDLAPHAARLNVPFTAITNVNDATAIEALRALGPDVICVFGWSQLVGAEVLAIPRFGVLGWHPSRLPENRGRGVVPWTIIQRSRETALSLFWIDPGMDSGDLAVQIPIRVAPDETAGTLYEKIERAGRSAIKALLAQGPPGEWPRHPQDHVKATWCARRVPEDGRLDWTLPADDVWTLVRASTRPYPGAYGTVAGRKVTIWAADLLRDKRHWAAPGQIVEIRDEGAVVQCGDRDAILIREWEWDGESAPPALKLHDRFGS